MIKTSILDIISPTNKSWVPPPASQKYIVVSLVKVTHPGFMFPVMFFWRFTKKTAKLNGKSINDTLRYFEYDTSSP